MEIRIVEIKELNPLLLKELLALEEESFGEGGLSEWTLPIVVKYGRVFALFKGSKVCGLAELIKYWSNPKAAFLIGLSITGNLRGEGLGEAFLEEIIRKLNSEDINKICLSVASHNKAALGLYEKVGFKPVGFVKDMYGKGRDRKLLELRMRG